MFPSNLTGSTKSSVILQEATKNANVSQYFTAMEKSVLNVFKPKKSVVKHI